MAASWQKRQLDSKPPTLECHLRRWQKHVSKLRDIFDVHHGFRPASQEKLLPFCDNRQHLWNINTDPYPSPSGTGRLHPGSWLWCPCWVHAQLLLCTPDATTSRTSPASSCASFLLSDVYLSLAADRIARRRGPLGNGLSPLSWKASKNVQQGHSSRRGRIWIDELSVSTSKRLRSNCFSPIPVFLCLIQLILGPSAVPSLSGTWNIEAFSLLEVILRKKLMFLLIAQDWVISRIIIQIIDVVWFGCVV